MPRRQLILLFCVALSLQGAAPPRQAPFPLRTDPPPKEWKADQIKWGLPCAWTKGVVHVLAWQVIDDGFPRILVLKKFEQPTERDGHRWVLAKMRHYPNRYMAPHVM